VIASRPPALLEPIAKDQASILRNLFELYVYDFSELLPIDLKPSGCFEVVMGDEWWTRDDHYPFFIRQAEKLVGFALARRGSRVTSAADVMDVAEFFVVRGARARGVGSAAAHELFTKLPGPWEIRVRRTNAAALRFWSRVAERWSRRPPLPEPFVVNGVDWNVLRLPAREAHEQ
jgi:predicted acetyltransferase